MDTTNINAIIRNSEKVSIEEALNKTLDQLISSKLISNNNIIHSYSHISSDESKVRVLTILPPATSAEAPTNILSCDNIWEELLTLISEHTKCIYLFDEYQQLIYNETESLQLSYNDETIDILYHYTGQW